MTLSGVCKIVSLIIIVSKITKGIPSYEGYCGTQHEMSSNRIFGGEVIQKENNEFPWVVSFHLRAKETFFCAGSLISDRHVLSGMIKPHVCAKILNRIGSDVVKPRLNLILIGICFKIF